MKKPPLEIVSSFVARVIDIGDQLLLSIIDYLRNFFYSK